MIDFDDALFAQAFKKVHDDIIEIFQHDPHYSAHMNKAIGCVTGILFICAALDDGIPDDEIIKLIEQSVFLMKARRNVTRENKNEPPPR